MTDPNAALKRALLRAGRADAPPPEARQKLLDALGVGDEPAPAVDLSTSGVRPVQAASLRNRSPRAADWRERPALFSAILGPGSAFYRRLRTPALVSFAAHAAVLALVIYGSTRPSGGAHIKEPELMVQLSAPAPAKAAPGGAAKVDVDPPRDPLPIAKGEGVRSAHAPEARPQVAELAAGDPASAPAIDPPDRIAPSAPAGAAVESVAGAAVAAAQLPAPPADQVIPFGPGMTRPQRIDGPDPVVPRAAREAKVEGTMLAKCIITTSGSLRGCRVIKSLPFMDQPVIEALSNQRYTPVTFQGRPVNVEYVIPLRVALP